MCNSSRCICTVLLVRWQHFRGDVVHACLFLCIIAVFVPLLSQCLTPASTKLSSFCMRNMSWRGSGFLWLTVQSHLCVPRPFQALTMSPPAFGCVNLALLQWFCVCPAGSPSACFFPPEASCVSFSYDFLAFLTLSFCPVYLKLSRFT